MFESVPHCFAVTDTIMGAIRKYNTFALDKVTRWMLLEEFKRLNGKDVVPRPGMSLLIPVRVL